MNRSYRKNYIPPEIIIIKFTADIITASDLKPEDEWWGMGPIVPKNE